MLKNILSLMALASMTIAEDRRYLVLQTNDMEQTGTPIRLEASLSFTNVLILKLGNGNPLWNATVDESDPTQLFYWDGGLSAPSLHHWNIHSDYVWNSRITFEEEGNEAPVR